MAPHQSARGYHAAAVLLPDGRVLVGGADLRQSDYEIWTPPQLACGLPRPERVGCSIADEVGGMAYRSEDPTFSFEISWDEGLPAGTTVEEVVLIRPDSVTHHSPNEARRIVLETERRDDDGNADIGSRLTVRPPEDRRVAPPGWYMLFALTDQGTPSEAVWVHLR